MSYITVPAALLVFAAGLHFQRKYLKKARNRDIYFESLIKSLPVGLYLRDLKGNFLISNDEFSKMTGKSAKQLEKMNLTEVFDPKYLVDIESEEKEIFKTKNSLTIEKTVSFFPNVKHSYRIIKTPVLDEKENIKAYIVLMKNIDKETAEHEAKESFIATLTHDLKTPTTAQINMLNLLYDGSFGELNSEQREMIRLTRCSCIYMSELIATVLDTYRYSSCELKMNFELFDINELLSSLSRGMVILANDKEQNIIFNHDNRETFVYGDRLQIKRVIVNLLSNAITYGFKNTPIIIDLKQKDGIIEFSVENKSRQIPEHVLKNLFKKFSKTDMTHFNKASTSLGLYLSKCIIDMHKGEIYAKSFEDGTCIFGFKLSLNPTGVTSQEKQEVKSFL